MRRAHTIATRQQQVVCDAYIHTNTHNTLTHIAFYHFINKPAKARRFCATMREQMCVCVSSSLCCLFEAARWFFRENVSHNFTMLVCWWSNRGKRVQDFPGRTTRSLALYVMTWRYIRVVCADDVRARLYIRCARIMRRGGCCCGCRRLRGVWRPSRSGWSIYVYIWLYRICYVVRSWLCAL